jgi:superfamily II DNA helicase RecQ
MNIMKQLTKEVTAAKSTGAADEVLMGMLRDLRKKVAKKIGVPPFVVFSRSFSRRYGF